MLKFSFLFFFISLGFSCTLKNEMISLSGPMTSQLFELGLRDDKKLIGISEFYPEAQSYSQKKISGGIYLPSKFFQSIETKTILILDESVDLEKMGKQLTQLNPKIIIKILKTKSKRSWAIVEEINDYLKSESLHCEQQMAQLASRADAYQKSLSQLPTQKIIFFLGEIKKESPLPSKVIINDLFVGDLISLGKLQTYPSQSAYVDWSQKILFELPSYKHVGLSMQPIKDNKNNFFHPKIFIPGIDQFSLKFIF